MIPVNAVSLVLSYWRWQLSATELYLAWWRAYSCELWRTGDARLRGSPGPGLAAMYRETMQDTFDSDEEQTTT